MSNTLASINLNNQDWINLNNLFAIPVGTAIQVQNQSSSPLNLAISPTKPIFSFTGVIVPPSTQVTALISAGESIIWGLGSGPVNIQVA